MSNKRKKSNQTGPVLFGLLSALLVIILCGFFLIRQVKSDDNKTNEVTSSVNSLPTTLPPEDTSSQADANVTSTEETTTAETESADKNITAATSLLLTDAIELVDRFGDKYDNYGYIDGGYTIGDDEVYPHLQFVVVIDEEKNISPEPVRSIIVTRGGKVAEDIYVGMTYKELETILGDKIIPIEETEDGCMFAYSDYTDYTITYEFECCGGESIKATIISK